jgi:hypothetical protein
MREAQLGDQDVGGDLNIPVAIARETLWECC